METTINNNELEQMRSQFDTLKQKLDGQKIVDGELIRSVMKHKMSWIHRYVWWQLVAGVPVICLFWGALAFQWRLSLAFYLFLVVGVAVSSVCDYVVNRMKDSDWDKANLLQTRAKLAKMNKVRMAQFWAGMLFVAVFMVWFYIEFDNYSSDKIEVAVTIGGGAIGAVVGIVYGYKIVSKMQRTNNEIIGQINEMTGQGGDGATEECGLGTDGAGLLGLNVKFDFKRMDNIAIALTLLAYFVNHAQGVASVGGAWGDLMGVVAKGAVAASAVLVVAVFVSKSPKYKDKTVALVAFIFNCVFPAM